MRSRAFSVAAALILAAGLLCPAAPGEKPEPAEKAAAGRLVRLDLLRKPPAAGVRVLRTIFIADRSAAAAFLEAERPPSGKSALPGPATETDRNRQAAAFAVRYLGCVTTAQKKVGLIFAGDDVLAVSEGDTLEGGYVVRTIRPQALELETADGRVLTVPIEGERR
ncbi:MAG: hypothetical protein A2Y56_05560 [Candidatus Aminicenantes bacterium RBG_13_63_10]|nr:MAG: hypothetical protein A2Y56_05560 [Candidatus Aminicenantes bacterium RBG_13_63_10]